jgi:hypothetical protein
MLTGVCVHLFNIRRRIFLGVQHGVIVSVSLFQGNQCIPVVPPAVNFDVNIVEQTTFILSFSVCT